MYAYSLPQWMAFFYIYCVCGWIFESAYVSIRNRRFVNRGFMTGPWIPLYGSGAVLILFVTLPVKGNYMLMFLLGAAAATVLEYFTGVVMERLFGVRYWDYSDQRFNFQGQICLSSTIVWGIMTVLMTEYIHPPVERLVMLVNEVILTDVTMAFTVVFTFDFAMAFRTAIDLKEMLMQAEKLRGEVQRMQKRVEVWEAVVADDISRANEERKRRASELADERLAELAFRLDRLRQRMEGSENLERLRRALEGAEPDHRLEDIQSEMRQMRLRLEGLKLNIKKQLQPRQRHLIGRNPSARSVRYKESWEYIKEKLKRGGQDE